MWIDKLYASFIDKGVHKDDKKQEIIRSDKYDGYCAGLHYWHFAA